MSNPVATTDADDPLLLDRQVCFPLYAATNLINRLYAPVLSALDLTYPQYLTMLVLWERDGQSVGALCARLHLDTGTLSPLLKRMEASGLIARVRDPVDERRVLVTLTERGWALRDRAAHVPATMALGFDHAGLDDLRDKVHDLVAILARHPKAG